MGGQANCWIRQADQWSARFFLTFHAIVARDSRYGNPIQEELRASGLSRAVVDPEWHHVDGVVFGKSVFPHASAYDGAEPFTRLRRTLPNISMYFLIFAPGF